MQVNRKLRVDCVSGIEQIRAMEQDWNMLERKYVKTIFLKYSWLNLWRQSYFTGYRLKILTVYDEKELVGILPLVMRHGPLGFRKLEIMGTGEISPNHLDIIVSPDRHIEVACALAVYLGNTSSEWDVLDLDKLIAVSPTIQILSNQLRSQNLLVRREDSATCLYITLPRTFDEYLRSQSHHFRRNLRRSQNHLHRDHPQAQFLIVKTAKELHVAMYALIRLHQLRWKKKGFPGSFSNNKFINFHLAAADHALKEGSLRIYYLQIDNEIIAVRYAYRISETVQGYLSSFDDRWAYYRPGILLLSFAIEQSILENVRYFDFLEGKESYKEIWTNKSQTNVRLRAFTTRVPGQLEFLYLRLNQILETWAIRFFPVKARRLLWQAILRGKSAVFRSD